MAVEKGAYCTLRRLPTEIQRPMSDNPLGQTVEMPDTYAPEVLFAIPRADARRALGITGALPFSGQDLWNAWELTWLAENGRPTAAQCRIRVPADSPSLVESKSLKLYLNSFAMSRFPDAPAVAGIIREDLARLTGVPVGVELESPAAAARAIQALPGRLIDELEVACDAWEVDASLLEAGGEIVEESLHTHLLRSLCPVTGQPDSGSLLVSYRGARIAPESLLRYVTSFRRHQDFHESCVERVFLDIMDRCAPDVLTVYARYQRRGGIDINPYRSTDPAPPADLRLWRQ